MRYLCDFHIHTNFSFDGNNTVDEICTCAVSKGIKEIAITDHYDADGIIGGYYQPYDVNGALAAVQEAREKYKSKLKIAFGIELGQPYVYAAESAALLDKYDFDFVIGAVHNIIDMPDFSFIKFEHMPQRLYEIYWERYLDDISQHMLEFEGFHTLAHLTYPLRYINRAGREFNLDKYRDRLARLMERLINKNICLEVNTSGLRQGYDTLPGQSLLKLYRESGGELLTCGSDAHLAAHVGADIESTWDVLKKIGFKYIMVYRAGKPFAIDL